MGMVIDVEVTAGTTVRSSVQDAMRLAGELDVLVRYMFDGVRVCVSKAGLLYALEEGCMVTAQWFMDQLNKGE